MARLGGLTLVVLALFYVKDASGAGCGDGCQAEIKKGPMCGDQSSEGVMCLENCQGIKAKAKLLKIFEKAACDLKLEDEVKKMPQCWRLNFEKCENLPSLSADGDEEKCLKSVEGATCVAKIAKEDSTCASAIPNLTKVNVEVIKDACTGANDGSAISPFAVAHVILVALATVLVLHL